MSDSVDAALGEQLYADSRVPTLTVDVVERRILDANAAAERFLGHLVDDLIGRPASDFLTEPAPDDELRLRSLRNDATRVIREVRTGSGSRIAEISISPTSREGIVFVQAFDITDLTMRDDSGSATDFVSRSDLDLLFDVAPLPAVSVDLTSRHVVRANAAMEQILGSPARALVGRPLDELISDASELIERLSELNRTGVVSPDPLFVTVRTARGETTFEVAVAGLTSTPLAVLQFVERTERRSRRRSMPATASDAMIEATPDRHEDAQLGNRLRRVCGWSLVALGGAVLLIGWWAGIDAVTRVAPNLASMKANTAAGLLALGAALLLSPVSRWSRLRPVVLGFVLAVGLLTVLEYAVGVDLGIDELLAEDTDLTGTSSPGRMGLNTAMCFGSIAVGMALLRSRKTVPIVVGQLAVIVAGAFAFLALAAYTFGVSGGRGLASSTEMALHTAIGVLIVSIGALATSMGVGVLSPLGAPLAGGRFARRAFLPSAGAVVGSGLLVRALASAGILTDQDLELAFLSLLITLSLFAVILLIADSSNQLDASAEQARRDLGTVLAAFADEHFRVGPDGLARRVTGVGTTTPRAMSELVPASIGRKLADAVARSRSERATTELTFSSDAEDRRLELRVAPLPDDDVAVSVRDISELAAARDALAELTASLEAEVRMQTEELQLANADLARSNADLEQFAYLASHDLQEPLRMVSTFVDKLADRLGDGLDARSRQYVDFAVDGAHRMAALVDGLLQYSRAGREPPTLLRVQLRPMVEEVVHTLDAQVMQAAAIVVIDDEMPDVVADETLLRQVLQNLLSNALKFTSPDRPPQIRVAADFVDDEVEISVVDNGIGVPEEFHQEIFHMFRRLHGRSQYPGTGIGLSLVMRLVESQGGTIDIDPQHGPDGSRFVVNLPAATDSTEVTDR